MTVVLPGLTPVPRHVLDLLARTGSDDESLDLLLRGQQARRLLLLRLLLDASSAAVPAERSRFRDHWDLLESAERSGPDAREAVHRGLQHPLVGPWARQALAGLTAGRSADLGFFGAVVVAAAVRCGLPFRTRLSTERGELHLPGLGALACGPDTDVSARFDGTVLRLTPAAGREVIVRPQPEHGAWSTDPGWRAAHALPALIPGGRPVPLDDLGPYRHDAALGIHAATLDDAGRKRWHEAWSGPLAALLRHGHPHQAAETGRLLASLVPVAVPEEAGPLGYCSGTRRDAFGCVYSSLPPGPLGVAEMLVHETQHAKLSALTDLVTLHHAPPDARYFAPWRPDPRPLDGLWQGVYSHLALALWWQGYVLNTPDGHGRERGWAEYARCREQVTAALGQLAGSTDLTPEGRRFTDGMIAAHRRLDEPPRPHRHRAQAYVATARELWKRKNQMKQDKIP